MGEACPISIDRELTHATSEGRNGMLLSRGAMAGLMSGVCAALDELKETAKLVQAVKLSPKYPYSGAGHTIIWFKVVLYGPFDKHCDDNNRLEVRGTLDLPTYDDDISSTISTCIVSRVREEIKKYIAAQEGLLQKWGLHT